jgi:hypothetical protein
VLVTGGAEGIAAECAIAFAEVTGMKVAVISAPDETAEPDPARRVIIERNLSRYARVSSYEHRFDDAASIAAVVGRVRAELGEIALVIHGAGASCEALMRTFERTPPPMFVALTSSAGIEGSDEDPWSAHASAQTHALLRAFAAKTGARTRAIAFDVWSPIGMGGRTGAITEFNRHGADAIPPAEGAKCFVELMTTEHDADEILVSARATGSELRSVGT